MANFANLGGPNVKVMGQADLSRLIVRGRGAHIATALTNLGWSKGPAVTILAKFEDGHVEGSRYEAIGSLKGVEIPLRNLDGETKDGVAMIDMSDLSKFTWPETSAATEPRNLSNWKDGLEMTKGLRTEAGTETDAAVIAKHKFFTERGFCMRIGIVPRAAGEALLYVVAAPVSLSRMSDILSKKGLSVNHPHIPTVGVKASQSGTSYPAEARYIPSEKSLNIKETGWGQFPLLENIGGQEPLEYPDSEELREEFFTELNRASGHTNKTQVWDYYPTLTEMGVGTAHEGAKVWPVVETLKMKPGELWPVYQPAASHSRNPNQGRTVVKVQGRKYGLKGGFKKEFLRNMTSPHVARILCEAANHSLAYNTWRSYESCWSQLGRIQQKMGLIISFPFTKVMVLSIIAFHMEKGLKGKTIMNYLGALKMAHFVRGVSTEALEDNFVKACIKGAINKDALKTKEPEAVIDVAKMRKIREWLKIQNKPYQEKRLLWCICTMLFMGSLRPSEILSHANKEYDPTKCLLGKDLKRLTVKIDGQETAIVQLTLKNPKTSKTMPSQIVEIPETHNFLCPVQAFDAWIRSMRAKPVGAKPLFSHPGEQGLVTPRCINEMLSKIFPGSNLTARCFRPGIITILARKGMSTEQMKDIGRWTSSSFNNYIKKGRCNNWAKMVETLRGLHHQDWE